MEGTACKRFGLELHPDKTRLIEFGRSAAEKRKYSVAREQAGDVRLSGSFTHMCGKTRKAGRFIVKRKTIRKRLSTKLGERWKEGAFGDAGASAGRRGREVVEERGPRLFQLSCSSRQLGQSEKAFGARSSGAGIERFGVAASAAG